MRLLHFAALLAGISLATSAHARDRSASFEELAKVLDQLKSAGCTALQSLDAEDAGYEAEGVVCNSEKFDINLDRDFNIVAKRKVRL